eukprot:954031_1
MQCQLEFCKCNASTKIKCVLDQFAKILSDQNNKSNVELETESNELIQNVLANGQYSNVQLMNDFYHIKYNHNTNDDPHQFDQFYHYLYDNEHALQCDIALCQAAQNYFHRRYQTSFIPLKDAEHGDPEEADLFTFNILCRVHTYFIHSHDVSQLPDDENNINKCIANHTKFIETTFEAIDCGKMAAVLKRNKINIDENALQMAVDENQYNMKHLMSDLCQIFTDKTDNETLLSSIIMNSLQLEDHATHKLQETYDAILRCGVITKQALNHHNFVKMLKISAFTENQTSNQQEIETIASDKHLTGKIYVKGSDEFMNSRKFAALFKSIPNWNKKRWAKVYLNINKWTAIIKPKSQPPIVSSDSKEPTVSTQLCIVEHSTEHKYDIDEAPIAYMDSGTDTHSIQTFCTLTKATKDIALLFLQETAWNMNVAVDRFFRFNGNVTSLNENNTNDQEGRFIQSNALQSNDVTKKHVTHSMIVKSYFDNECDWEEDEESKMIVDGFIHRIEHHYSFCYHIPQTIFHLCFLFYYDDTFLNSGVDLYYVGPFQILFAEFRYQSALSMGNWDIDAFSINMQAEQLQLANISTDSARKEVANVLVQNVYATLIDPTSLLLINKEIMRMLSRYLHEIQTIQLKPIARWSQRDIMLSIISYVIETSASDDSKNKRNTLQPRIWEFMLHLRRYFYEEAYDGKHLFDVPVWKDENKPKKPFGLQMMQMVCRKYQLKSGPFSKAKKIIHFWHISLETQTNALTPFHTLFSIFECQYGSLSVFMGSVDTQVHLLQLSNIVTESQRERVANDIIHNMDLLDSTTLIQINEEILRMLSSYVRETQAMRHKPTALWSHRDVVLSFISCIIDGLENKSDSSQSIALWKFVEYLRRYCYDQAYNGQKLVNDFNTLNQQTSQQSIGLKLLDDVCAKYEIKSEQFTKIQMEIMFWSSKFNCHSSPFKILCAEFEHMYTYTFTFTPYIDTQAQLLKFSNIVSDCGFKHAIGALNDHMQIHDINDVQDTLKIHEETVRILSRYVGDMLSVKHKPIASWSRHDTIISLISYLIDASVHDDSCWLFVEYFRRYCHERPYDGIDVLNDLNPTRLHTATLISNVCSKYDIKQEKFHTMKDHIILWMKEVYEQHETGDAWLWFNADPDVLCWLAHSKSDTKKLNTAWQNGSKSCLVSNDRGRVEFDRSNPTQPSGNQFCHGTETSRYGEASEEAPDDAFQYSVPVAYNINWSNVYPLTSDIK